VPGLGPLSFSPDGKQLATAERDHSVRLWSTRTGTSERTLKGHTKRIVALRFSPDGRLLLTGSKDWTARLWDLDSKRVRELAGHKNELTSARFSPDGRLVVTTSRDNDVRLWDAQTGRLVKPVLSKHFAIVSDARFSDDGRWLVTAGPKAAGLWEVRSHKLISLLRGPFVPRLIAAAFVPGTHTIVTAGDDGTIRTYFCDVCAGVKGLEGLATTRLAQVGTQQ
jgi:WD40 repeat protein